MDMDDPLTSGFDTGSDAATGAGLIQADTILASLFNEITASNSGKTRGSGKADLMIGTGKADRLDGLGGTDVIEAGAGNDRASGGSGRDMLRGGAGNDRLFGGAGGDKLQGGAGRDHLRGDGGADILRGESGPDLLTGGAGADTVSGGGGRDTLFGGSGDDVFHGGALADRFIYDNGRDRYLDFTPDEGDTLLIHHDGRKHLITSYGALVEFAERFDVPIATSGHEITLQLSAADRLTLETGDTPAGDLVMG